MQSQKLTFAKGYEAFIANSGSAIGADGGAAYVGRVEDAIKGLTDAINNPRRSIDNVSIEYLKGFMAEQWFAETFNIDAVVRDLPDRAKAIDNNGKVDIIASWGANYQAKINKDPNRTAKILSITNEGKSKMGGTEYHGDSDPSALYYAGQHGIVATDKINDIRAVLEREIAHNKEIRPEVSANYQKVLDNLTNKIKSDKGAESLALTEEESRILAQLAKEKGFDPADRGIRTEQLITFEYLMNQAFKAGLTAAMLSILLKVVPEICGIIAKLIKEGEIDAKDFKRIGFAAVKGGAEGFVRGTLAAGITIACKQGLLGVAMKKANPFLIATITVYVLNTVKSACLMAFGRIGRHEFVENVMRDFIITACAFSVGMAGAILMKEVAVIGYMIGSFVGSVIGSFVYKGVYSCILSYCIDSGCTFFGLVEQDYVLPKATLEAIGIKVFDYEKVEPKKLRPKKLQFKQLEYKKFEPLEINIGFLRRGVISVGVIGYY